MTLSNNNIIYELNRMKRTLQILEKLTTDTCKDFDKLIGQIEPIIMKRQDEEIEDNENNDLSLNADEEIMDYVASLNSSNARRPNNNQLNSSGNRGGNYSRQNITEVSYIREEQDRTAFIEENQMRHSKRPRREESNVFSNHQSVLRENRSIDNFNNISLSGSNSISNINISKFTTATKSKRTSEPHKRLPQSDAKLYESRSLKENSLSIEHTHSKPKPNIFYSLKEYFARNSETKKKELCSLSNISLFIHDHQINIIYTKNPHTSRSNSNSHPTNLITAKIGIKEDVKHVTGLAYQIKFSLKPSKTNNINNITSFEKVSAEEVTSYPNKRYLILLCDNKQAYSNIDNLSKEQITQFLTGSLIYNENFSVYPVLIKDSAIFELSAEFKNEDSEQSNEIKEIFTFGIGAGNKIPQNTHTIHNNNITNNISSASMVCLNQSSIEDQNYFKNNYTSNPNGNMMLGRNWNNRNLNNFNAPQFSSGFSANTENNCYNPNNINSNLGSNIQNFQNYNYNNFPVSTENCDPNNNSNNSRIGYNNQLHNPNHYNKYPDFNNNDMDY